MPNLSEEGDFLAIIEEYALQEAKESDAIAVGMKFQIFKQWDEIKKIWVDRQHGERTYGSSWIIKRDGTINQPAQESLIQASGWDGQIESVIDQTWKPWPVRITVEENYYEGNRSYRVAWINHADSTGGGGLRQIDDEKANLLCARFSSQLRASAAAIQKDLHEAKHDVLNPEPKNPPPQPATPEELPF